MKNYSEAFLCVFPYTTEGNPGGVPQYHRYRQTLVVPITSLFCACTIGSGYINRSSVWTVTIIVIAWDIEEEIPVPLPFWIYFVMCILGKILLDYVRPFTILSLASHRSDGIKLHWWNKL